MAEQEIRERLSQNQQLEYAWKWFEYHAEQRMRAFYYFLIIIGALSYGYIYCLTQKINNKSVFELAPRIAFIAAIIAIVFLFVEYRNLELVNYGRNELSDMGLNVAVNNKKDSKDKSIFKRLFTHSVCFQYIYGASFFIALSQFIRLFFETAFPFLGSPGNELFCFILLPLIFVFKRISGISFNWENIGKWLLLFIALEISYLLSFFIWPFCC